jgi:hypothetical protein
LVRRNRIHLPKEGCGAAKTKRSAFFDASKLAESSFDRIEIESEQQSIRPMLSPQKNAMIARSAANRRIAGALPLTIKVSTQTV